MKDKVRLLKKLQAELATSKFDKREHKVGARYHKVKFFERQKVTRALKRASKELASASDGSENVESLRSTIRECQERLLYIRWYPRHVKYLSLFPKDASKDRKHDERVAAIRIWALRNAEAGEYLREKPTEAPKDIGAVIARRLTVAVQRGEELLDLDEESDEEGGDEEGDDDVDGDSHDDIDDSGSEIADGDDDSGDDSGSESDGAAAQRAAKAAALRAALVKAAAPPAAKRAKTAAAPAVRPASRSNGPADEATLAAALARPLTSKPSRRQTVVLPPAADEDDAAPLDAAAAPAAAPAPVGFAGDSFFSAAPMDGGGAMPVFREEEDGEDGEGGGGGYEVSGADYRGFGEDARRAVHGPTGAAARYEREHMNSKRYRDSAASRPAGQASNAPEADLSHLSGRKRRRAERALSYSATKAGDGGGGFGGALPNSSRYTEAFYGTDRDPGARLKSAGRPPTGFRAGPPGAGGFGRSTGGDSDSRGPPAFGAAAAGGGFRPSFGAPQAAAPAPAPQPAAQDLSSLTGRALKRAQRAVEHQAKKSGAAAPAPAAPAPVSQPPRPAASAFAPRAAVSTFAARAAAPAPAPAPAAGGYADLSHLTGRALKRAQRAMEHHAKKNGDGAAAGAPASAAKSAAPSGSGSQPVKRIKFVEGGA